MDNDGKIWLKRGNIYIVIHNPTIVIGHGCNVELKYVGSGPLGMAMSIYMTNYSAKTSIDSATMMTAMCMAVESMNREKEALPDDGERSHKLLLKTLNQMSARREMSAQQVSS